VGKLESLLDPAKPLPDVVVLDMGQAINCDTTGLDALESLHAALERRGGRLVLADLNEQPASLVHRSGFAEALGRENIFPSVAAALDDVFRKPHP
jgi:SulP family sulfate permease